jgi:arylsulfatase A-like enzyme
VPRLVLLYATCTVNHRFLSPYAPAVRYTPHLAEFAHDAIVFARHHTESGQSGVSFASLFSGVQADGHGVYTIPQRLPDGVHTITEIFRDAGFGVHAWLAHPMASAELNYAQGVAPADVSDEPLHGDDPRFVRILDELRADPEARALLVTNFTVTHGPYRARRLEQLCARYPEECAPRGAPSFEKWRRLHQRRNLPLSFDFDAEVRRLRLTPVDVEELVAATELLYKAGIFELDEMFGAVVERIERAGLLDEAVIAFTADHGEVLFRRNATFQWSHSLQLAPEVIQVPFILQGRGAGLGRGRHEGVTRSVDVLPTLAGLAGVALRDPNLAGVDLTPGLRRERAMPELLAFSHTAVVPPAVMELMGRWQGFGLVHPRGAPELMWVAVRHGNTFYKLRALAGRTPEPEVYDWDADPGETRNRYEPSDDEQRRILSRLADYRTLLVESYRNATNTDPPAERQRQLLRSLGYIE